MKSPADPQPVSSGKSRGRPRVEEPRASVYTWLPAGTHDRLIALAKREEQSISATVRQLLTGRLK
jgi:hypothetical protein